MNRICWPCFLVIGIVGLIYGLVWPTPAQPQSKMSAMEICETKLSHGNCVYALR